MTVSGLNNTTELHLLCLADQIIAVVLVTVFNLRIVKYCELERIYNIIYGVYQLLSLHIFIVSVCGNIKESWKLFSVT